MAEVKPLMVALYGEKGEVWKYSYWEVSAVMAYRRDTSRFIAKQGEAAGQIAEEKAKAKMKGKR